MQRRPQLVILNAALIFRVSLPQKLSLLVCLEIAIFFSNHLLILNLIRYNHVSKRTPSAHSTKQLTVSKGLRLRDKTSLLPLHQLCHLDPCGRIRNYTYSLRARTPSPSSDITPVRRIILKPSATYNSETHRSNAAFTRFL